MSQIWEFLEGVALRLWSVGSLKHFILVGIVAMHWLKMINGVLLEFPLPKTHKMAFE